MDVPRSLYVPTDDGFTATALTVGPWDPGLQHAGPPAALLARAVERAGGIAGGQAVRLAYDILGPVPVGPVRVRAFPRSPPSSRRTSPTTGRWTGGSRRAASTRPDRPPPGRRRAANSSRASR